MSIAMPQWYLDSSQPYSCTGGFISQERMDALLHDTHVCHTAVLTNTIAQENSWDAPVAIANWCLWSQWRCKQQLHVLSSFVLSLWFTVRTMISYLMFLWLLEFKKNLFHRSYRVAKSLFYSSGYTNSSSSGDVTNGISLEKSIGIKMKTLKSKFFVKFTIL